MENFLEEILVKRNLVCLLIESEYALQQAYHGHFVRGMP